MIRIAVLEDNDVLRKRLIKILNEWDYVSQAHGFSGNQEFIQMNLKEGYDVLLADLSLNGENGEDSISYFVNERKENFAIVISSSLNPARILSAIKSGAIGYLHKDDPSIRIIGAIEMALGGASPISPSIAALILNEIQGNGVAEEEGKHSTSKKVNVLTKREAEVLNLITRGLTNKEVATAISISRNTVDVHVRNIYTKLQTSNRTETIFEARAMGIIK